MAQPKEFTSNPLKERLHEIIFEADTKAGKLFDATLLVLILLSVIIVMLESVPSYGDKYHTFFLIVEWFFTIIFTIEYALRIYVTVKPLKYITSFYGIVDLLSIVPTYLSIFVSGSQYFMIIRALRLLRVFRIFKLGNHLDQGSLIVESLIASRRKLTVFVFFVMLVVTLFGSIMYLIEGAIPGTKFDSIPRSIYWAIVTLTTVGYGDIAPQTSFGQFLSAIIMIMGYAVIAVPTGIISAEVMSNSRNTGKRLKKGVSTQACRHCSKEGHDRDAIYCKYCGESINLQYGP